MKNKEYRPLLEVISLMKNNNINFYNLFSYVDAEPVRKEDLYNCTISYKFNNFHGENCYFDIIAFNHDTKQEIYVGTIYTKSTILHPTTKTSFYYSKEAAAMLYDFMVYFDILLNEIYFNN